MPSDPEPCRCLEAFSDRRHDTREKAVLRTHGYADSESLPSPSSRACQSGMLSRAA